MPEDHLQHQTDQSRMSSIGSPTPLRMRWGGGSLVPPAPRGHCGGSGGGITTTIASSLALLVGGWRLQPPPPQKRERERMRKRERQREREGERFIMCGERGDREFEFVFCGRPVGGLSPKG